MARYRRIYPRLWAQLEPLSDAERVVALYCLSGPQTNRIGYFRLSIGRMAEDLRTDPGPLQERLMAVCERFGWQYDGEARVLWIPSFWTWNPPENPSVLKSLLSDLDEVPYSQLFPAFCGKVDTLPESLRSTFRSRVGARVRSRVGARVAEQEQEPLQEQEPSLGRNGDSPEGFEDFWTLYPRKTHKRDAMAEWNRLAPDPDLQKRILTAVQAQRRSDEWKREDGRYVPHPSRWLEGRRWEDEPPEDGRSRRRAADAFPVEELEARRLAREDGPVGTLRRQTPEEREEYRRRAAMMRGEIDP